MKKTIKCVSHNSAAEV